MRMDDRRLALYLALGLTLLTLIAYLPALDNGFVGYDDRVYVTENPTVQAGVTAAGLRWAATAVVAANWHPLTLLSHMVDCRALRAEPARPSPHQRGAAPRGRAAALRGAAADDRGARCAAPRWRRCSPCIRRTSESVAWVAERKDVLCGCFWMLTLAAYSATCGGGRRAGRRAGGAGCAISASPALSRSPCWPSRWR